MVYKTSRAFNFSYFYIMVVTADVSVKKTTSAVWKPRPLAEAICDFWRRHLGLWPSGVGSRLGRNRLWVRFLAVSDIYPMFIEPTIILGSLRGYLHWVHMAWHKNCVKKDSFSYNICQSDQSYTKSDQNVQRFHGILYDFTWNILGNTEQ